MNGFWSENKGWIVPILVFVWALYSKAVWIEWVSVWSDKQLGTKMKLGYSVRALASCAGPCLVAMWKQYGGSIIAFVVTLFRVKFGLPVAARRVGLIKR